MKTVSRSEDDDWTAQGRKITDPEVLGVIRQCLEERGPVIVEHWLYRGSSAPRRSVIVDFEDFVEYLENSTCAGDAIHVWDFASVCQNDNELAYGKFPDEEGLTPSRGAY